jgi:hypothetical protein
MASLMSSRKIFSTNVHFWVGGVGVWCDRYSRTLCPNFALNHLTAMRWFHHHHSPSVPGNDQCITLKAKGSLWVQALGRRGHLSLSRKQASPYSLLLLVFELLNIFAVLR